MGGDFSVGDLVRSTAGRDAGKLMFVVGTDDAHLFLADGKVRPIDRPKRKKKKHIRYVSTPEGRVPEKMRSGDKVTNSELRRTVAALAEEFPDWGGPGPSGMQTGSSHAVNGKTV